MFGFLKKKLEEAKKGLEKLVSREEEAAEVREAVEPLQPKKAPEKPKPETERKEKLVKREITKPKRKLEEGKEEIIPQTEIRREEKPEEAEEKEKPKKESVMRGFLKRITVRPVSEDDIDEFFADMELDLLQGNVALEVVDALKKGLKARLAGQEIKRTGVSQFIENAFHESLYDIVNQGEVDIDKLIKKAKEENRPALFIFLGFNGAGKTTSMAKCAKYLIGKGYKVIFAAGDTFRAASIEQLEVHAKRLGIGLVKQKYGADSAAVIYDAVEHAKANNIDAVLADTAGRMHTNVNLMRELEKVVRINRPDLKILVLDSLAGNDIVPQSQNFNSAVGVDCLLLTKTDVNEKGGAILSATYCTSKPILFLGTGQGYEDLELFEAEKFVKMLLE